MALKPEDTVRGDKENNGASLRTERILNLITVGLYGVKHMDSSIDMKRQPTRTLQSSGRNTRVEEGHDRDHSQNVAFLDAVDS